MTPRQKELVQGSFEQLKPSAEPVAAMFYGRLFELNPKLERLFKGDREEQGRKLMHMIGVAVKGLNRLNELIPLLRELGRRHTNYGVSEQDYETVGMALLWTLEHGLGEAFNAEVRGAWVAVYKLIATTMQEGARESVVIVTSQEPATCSGGRRDWRGYFPAAASRTSNQKEPEIEDAHQAITGRFARTLLTLVFALFVFTATAQANTYTVTTTADNVQNPPAGSLRKAIVDANNHPGADVINFNIPGAGVHTIMLAYDLPSLSEQVKIDGYSQPGATANSQDTGSNAVPLIVLNGSNLGVNGDGLYIDAPNCEVAGLVINNFKRIGIHISPFGHDAAITGCFIGTNADGNATAANGIGVFIYFADGTEVGGLSLSKRNLISGNLEEGIRVVHTSIGVKVFRNLIGTDKSGTGAIPNGTGVGTLSAIGSSVFDSPLDLRENVISGNKTAGISLTDSRYVLVRFNRIGTTAYGTGKVGNGNGIQIDSSENNQIEPGNVISANLLVGILIEGNSSKNFVSYNMIGTDLNGANSLGNGFAGINITGDAANNLVQSNTIAFNPRGVALSASTGNSLRGNSTFSNSSLGIDLIGSLGLDPNDPDDSDAGPNNLQNFPVITSAFDSAGKTIITGTLNSEDKKTYVVEFFASPQCGSSGYGEGKNFLDSLVVKTIGHDAAFSGSLPAAGIGQFITATATDPDGNTSEFSKCKQVVALPPPPNMSINDVSVSEGNSGQQQITFSVSLSNTTFQDVTVDYATTDGTATVPSDYAPTAGVLKIPAGSSTGQIVVTINNDLMFEPDETFLMNLSNPKGAIVTKTQGKGTITNNDPQPTITISDIELSEGNSGTTPFDFAISLSNPSYLPITVQYDTADGSATAGSDYQAANSTFTFQPGQPFQNVPLVVNVIGDQVIEERETFFLNLSNPVNATIVKGQGTGTVVNDDAAAPPTIQFSQAAYGVAEQLGAITVTVTRSGDATKAASVDYVTTDGSAAQKTDFEYAAGTLNFGPGEVSKTFIVLLNQDSYIEGPESFNLVLSNPAGAALGAQAVSQVSITDDLPETLSNPIDDAQTFVYMHYHDFLSREPDPAGLAFWTNEITSCGNDAQCVDNKRINVSAAFFLSIEFQETGYLRYLMQKASFGSTPKYAEFMRDVQEVSRGVIVNSPGWEQKLKDNQQQFAEKWIARPEFKAVYDGLSNDGYVNALYTNAGIPVPQVEKDKLVTALNAASMNRATVLLDVANDATFRQQEQNAAFVMMEYFGYLRRDPNAAPDSDLSGYNFWLNKLNQFGGNYVDAEMIKAFITSFEYRQRFAQ